MHDRTNTERVLFLYLRDKNDPDHVATLARFKKGNVLTFAWAINKVTELTTTERYGKVTETRTQRIVHDVFKKSRGRVIAEGRLACFKSSISIELHENERPLGAMLETLANCEECNGVKIPLVLFRLAHEALEAGV